MSLDDLKSKFRAFYKRKFKGKPNDKELALPSFSSKYKGTCKNCGKQGHKAVDCRSKPAGTRVVNKSTKTTVGKGVKCFNCNKYAGHISRDCPEPRRELPTSNKEASLTKSGMFVGVCEEIHQIDNNDYDPSDSRVISAEFCGTTITVERWLADTGATSHISTSDTSMTNVEKVSIVVVVGNGNEITCFKRGDIRLHTQDGKVLTLKKVLYTLSSIRTLSVLVSCCATVITFRCRDPPCQ